MYFLSLLKFFEKGFRLQLSVFNDCHDVLMMSFGISSVDILNIYGIDYYCIIFGISNQEIINLLKIFDLSEKDGLI